jgi:hypothetical protein
LSSYEHKFRDDLENRLIDILFSWKDREDNPTLGKVFEACKDAKVGAAVRREDNPTLGKVFEACKDAKVGAAVRRALLAISKVRAELESRCSRNCKGKLRQAIAVF